MGEYRLPEKLATMELDDIGMPGGEITVSLRLPMALFEELANIKEHRLAELRPLFCQWGLRDWNLTDHAGPIPADEVGMKRLEANEQMLVIAAYLRGVVDPPAPLSPPSSDTEPSEETSPPASPSPS